MKQLYKDLIQTWQNRALPTIVPRQISLDAFVDSNLRKIITVTGFRRVGKTYSLLDYASKIGQKNCVYINFEDERIPSRVQSLTSLSDTINELDLPPNTTLLLDEIQNIPGWSKWARRINETTQLQLILTGSSSSLSSRELPTELRGRSLSVQINPLNFKEFLRFKETDLGSVPISTKFKLLNEFINFGGLPEIVLADEGKKYLLLGEYFKTFVSRDVLERYKIRKENTLNSLLNLLLNSTEYTANKLATTLKSVDESVSRATINRYITYLQNSYFLQSLVWHDPSAKNRMRAPRKAYFVDSFFISNSSGFSNNTGRLMEQKVYEKLSETIRENPAKSLYYWRNQQRYEVDFVVRDKEKTVALVQVCYVSTGQAVPEREIRNLVLGGKRLNCTNLTLVTWDIKNTKMLDGVVINYTPLADFLC
ncbi:MAG: ATP-binding protein [bacterium]